MLSMFHYFNDALVVAALLNIALFDIIHFDVALFNAVLFNFALFIVVLFTVALFIYHVRIWWHCRCSSALSNHHDCFILSITICDDAPL